MRAPTRHRSLAALRALLTREGSPERWREAVALVQRGGAYAPLLRDTLLFHASQDPSWAPFRFPEEDTGQRPEPFPLTEHARLPLPSLPDATLIRCPPASFWMGAVPGDRQAPSWQRPGREVTLTRTFWALSTPVTQAMYQQVMGHNPARFRSPRRPVESVSWFDCVRFCNELSRQEGLTPALEFVDERWVWRREASGFRLPTEAEWELLCKAGSPSHSVDALDDVAWWAGNSANKTHPVCRKSPNAWGFSDTLGNVSEWCLDELEERAYARVSPTDPVYLTANVTFRVRRGGHWAARRDETTPTSRGLSAPRHRVRFLANRRSSTCGFRIVRQAERGVEASAVLL